MSDSKAIPCKVCRTLTPMKGTKLCDLCWEVTTRLPTFLTKGSIAKRFVLKQLAVVEIDIWVIEHRVQLVGESVECSTVALALDVKCVLDFIKRHIDYGNKNDNWWWAAFKLPFNRDPMAGGKPYKETWSDEFRFYAPNGVKLSKEPLI